MGATWGVKAQRALSLRMPLAAAVPDTIEGLAGRDLTISEEERQVAGVTDYLMRIFPSADTTRAYEFSVYIGYYDRQTQGKTIHSPRNCLPGSGWEPLTNQPQRIVAGTDTVIVNRYLLQNRTQQALVLYWYQGRGRVASNEYRVKWDLLRDAALRRRSDEALVRVVVPVRSGEDAAALAVRVAETLAPAVAEALPL
jgi:EpsI family protein